MIQGRPEAIMINVPESFFLQRGEGTEEIFRRYYESMGQPGNEGGCFYHWISTCPKHDVTTVYVCFRGKVQYKAILVDRLKNKSPFEGWEQRDYVVTTGPVVKPPEEIIQRGFRGFRYLYKHLF